MSLKPMCVINARDLDDAWFQSLYYCTLQNSDKTDYMYSNVYTIDKGSYKGQQRLELDVLVLNITNPTTGPLVPVAPPNKSYLIPWTEQTAINYCANYLLQTDIKKEENYTYGRRIGWQLKAVVDMYRKHTNTNQAIIEIGNQTDVYLDDPPCLRLIDTRLRNNTLHFFVYFRSWDLYNGLPINLGGLTILMKYMAAEIGEHIKPGSITAFSKGAHIYDDMWQFAKERVSCT